MMTLQVVSSDEKLLYEVADFLLHERLIANAMITGNTTYKEKNKEGMIITSQQFLLKAISKSLLFSRINDKLREKYYDRMPLIYSEPIILIETKATQEIIDRLVRV